MLDKSRAVSNLEEKAGGPLIPYVRQGLEYGQSLGQIADELRIDPTWFGKILRSLGYEVRYEKFLARCERTRLVKSRSVAGKNGSTGRVKSPPNCPPRPGASGRDDVTAASDGERSRTGRKSASKRLPPSAETQASSAGLPGQR